MKKSAASLFFIISFICYPQNLLAVLPSKTEAKKIFITSAIIAKLKQKNLLNNDIPSQLYIQKLITRLQSTKNTHPVYCFLVKNPQINAFALPYHWIGIHTGLVQFADSENELAAVLAHELAHIEAEHLEELNRYLDRQQWAPLAATFIAILLAMHHQGAAAQSMIYGSQAAHIDQLLRLNREAEAQADRLGMQLLEKADFPRSAMVTFLEHLDRKQHFYTQPPPFLSTHPLTPQRLQEARRLSQNEVKEQKEDPLLFHLIQARLSKTQKKSFDTKSPAVKSYHHILIQAHYGHYEKAISLLKDLMVEYPNEILFSYTMAEIQYQQGHLLLARQTLQSLECSLKNHFLYPASVLLEIELSLAQGHFQEAIELLQKLSFPLGDKTHLHYLEAKLYFSLNNSSQFTMAYSRYLWQEGQWSQSLKQLSTLLKNTNKNEALYHQVLELYDYYQTLWATRSST
jgi:beta-barrel assembly-enhancing protease